ncbi:uncharacterized protein LOC121236546 [Juglans microcarpa x Juglans regia]|uniref:uncharacterized protein LOC121236546 n=1 Tax=Juglans microcarpa x Juglans regia TaxID=2249226 RepID=UPI001B7E1CA6|nr:uncharacterized protein LOC121236546 [Juglans microcarpa x Juglans regia]
MVLSSSAQHVTVSILFDSHPIVVSVVYAKCNYLERRELWSQLQLDLPTDDPWLCIGDFNIIREDMEQRGGRPRLWVAMEDFNDFIDSCGLTEMKSVGSKFSWCNGQKGMACSCSKLDRCLLNPVAASLMFEAFVK